MKKNIKDLIRTGVGMALFAFPSLSHAVVDTYTWNVSSGDFGSAASWSNPSSGPLFSSGENDQYNVTNGGTLTVYSTSNPMVSGDNTTGTVNIGASYLDLASGNNDAGGSLVVNSNATLDVASLETSGAVTGVTGTPSIQVSGTINVGSANLQVGYYDSGSMTVNSGGTVTETSNVYLGNAGPSYTSSADKGNGTITNSGTFSVTGGLLIGVNGGTGKYVNDGGATTVGTFSTNHNTAYSSSTSTLEMEGSSGSLKVTGGGGGDTINGTNYAFDASTPTGATAPTLEFVFDSGGIAPILFETAAGVANKGNADIYGVNFEFDLDSAMNGTYTLLNTDGGSILDSFGTSETVYNNEGSNASEYATLSVASGNLILNITDAPEPSTFALMGLGLGFLILRHRRRSSAL